MQRRHRGFVYGLMSLALSLASCSSLHEQGPSIKGPPPARLKEWREARFGMFIHWGPVSLKGTEIGWSRGASVPVEEYDHLYERFNPVQFDADAWVSVARAAGMKYLVLVTKHHDGFCMWDTKQTDFNVMNSPFHRDVVGEIAAACRRQGLAFGTYYSVCDWHHPDFPLTSPGGKVKRETSNIERYDAYLKGEVKELITRYGPLETIWFDVPQMYDGQRGRDLIRYVRSLQRDIVINDRTGAGGDYNTPEQRVGICQFDRPWETCMTIGGQWAWKPNERIKSLQECLSVLVRCAGGDGNLLFNVGPTPEGIIEPAQVARLREMGAWLEKYGESIYGTRGGPWMPSASVASTRRDKTIYLHLLKPATETLVLPPISRTIVQSSALTGGHVTVEQSDNGVSIRLSPDAIQQPVTVVRLELKGSAMKLPIMPGTGPLARASNVYQNDDDYAAAAAVDGELNTRWATDGGTKQAWIELDYGRPVTFEGIRIREEYQRVRKFELQVAAGKGWKTIFEGTTIGGKFEQKMAKTTARVLRLNILDATDGPTIKEIEVLPARD